MKRLRLQHGAYHSLTHISYTLNNNISLSSFLVRDRTLSFQLTILINFSITHNKLPISHVDRLQWWISAT